MLYATYAKGYRSGGFNGRVDEFVPSATDTLRPRDSRQLSNSGLKLSGWTSGYVLNGAIFYMDYEDKQEEIGLPSEGDDRAADLGVQRG